MNKVEIYNFVYVGKGNERKKSFVEIDLDWITL